MSAPIAAITGATGFIGRRVLRQLRGSGWQLRALYRPKPGGPLPKNEPQLDWIAGDLATTTALRRLVDGAAAVIHCAGAVRGAALADFLPANADGVGAVARAAAQHGVPRFLLISSLAAREPALSPYAASKREGEERLAAAAPGLARSILRPPAVYGPGDRAMLPLLRLMHRGIVPSFHPQGRFSLLYVDDLATAVASWLTRGEGAAGLCSEIDDGRPGGYGWDDIAAILRVLYRRKIRRIPVPPGALLLTGRLNASLGRWTGHCPLLTPGKVRELFHPDWVCRPSDWGERTGWRPHTDFAAGMRHLFGEAKRPFPPRETHDHGKPI